MNVVVSRKLGEAGAQVRDQTIAATDQMDRNGQRAYLWTPIVVLLLAPFAVLLTAESRQAIWVAFAAMVGLTVGSMIPTVIGYPVAHTILEGALTIGALGYVGVCFAAATWLPALLPRASIQRQQAEASSPLPTAAQ